MTLEKLLRNGAAIMIVHTGGAFRATLVYRGKSAQFGIGATIEAAIEDLRSTLQGEGQEEL